MKNCNRLSTHANQRLYERTYLNDTALLKLMESNSFFLLGKEIGNDKWHCLIYSTVDDKYFVAIKDSKTHSIVTILPLEYHLNFEVKLDKYYVSIDDEIKRRSRLAATSKLSYEDLYLKLTIKVIVVDFYGVVKTYEIKKIRFTNDDYFKLVTNHKKANNILKQWVKKNKGLRPIRLFLSIGRTSIPFDFEIE